MNYNGKGRASIQLPQGPSDDSYQIYLYVNIIDDTDGTTTFHLRNSVIVTPNNELATNLADSIKANEVNNPFLIELNSGNLNLVCKNVIALSTVFNIQSNTLPSAQSSQNENAFNDQMALLREFMVNKVARMSVTTVSSVKVISSALSTGTQTTTQVSSNSAVNISYYI